MNNIKFYLIFLYFIFVITPAHAELVGYWNFDENSGDIVHDSSGYHHDGSRNPVETSWTDGQYGSALNFIGNAIEPSVTLPYSKDILGYSSEYSLMAWIRLSHMPTSSYHFVIFEWLESPEMHYLSIGPEAVEMGYNLTGWIRNPRYNILNEWTHIAITCNERLLKMYFNGILVQEVEYKYNMPSWYMPLQIGWGFNGDIDELKIYNHALSAWEVNLAMLNDGVAGGDPPIMVIPAEFVEADVNEDIVLSAEGSYDPDGDIIYYRWTRLPEKDVICFSPDPTCPTKGTGKVKDLIRVEAMDNVGNVSEDYITIVDSLSAYLYIMSQQE